MECVARKLISRLTLAAARADRQVLKVAFGPKYDFINVVKLRETSPSDSREE